MKSIATLTTILALIAFSVPALACGEHDEQASKTDDTTQVSTVTQTKKVTKVKKAKSKKIKKTKKVKKSKKVAVKTTS